MFFGFDLLLAAAGALSAARVPRGPEIETCLCS